MIKKALFDRYPELKVYRENLKEYSKIHQKALEIIATRDWLSMDLLLFAFINRSLSITSGFILLVENENFIAAAPLVRLQLDNLLRLIYLASLKDGDEILQKTLKGINWNKIKDKNGKPLSDSRLRNYAHKYYSWVDDVYKKASKFVHFSEQHFLAIVNEVRDNRQISFIFSEDGVTFTKEEWKDLLLTFNVVTEAVCDALKGGAQFKMELQPESTIKPIDETKDI